MFVAIAIFFILCGILLLLKSRKPSKKQGVRMAAGAGAVLLIILGGLLVYCLLSGKIVLPLH